MAAAREIRAPQVVDLRQLPAQSLDTMLDLEVAEWQTLLGWDFRPSADLVRRFVGMQSLSGYALLSDGVTAGYTYFVAEGEKGLIGDLYLVETQRTAANEALLLEAALVDLFGPCCVSRVESQLMMLRMRERDSLPRAEFLTVHPRQFMVMDAARITGLKPGRAARKALVENWSPRRHEEAAQVIEAAYRGHIDGEVNDQYRSASGARRFLANIMQYPGCGLFFQPASYVAVDVWTGRACGVSLTSMLSAGMGHVTQICVVPSLKGSGLGYELLRRSLLALLEAGCRQASLTVTTANADAVRLYRRVGFETAHSFSALVWDRGQQAPSSSDR